MKLLRTTPFVVEKVQQRTNFYVDGYFHRHFTKRELRESLAKSRLDSIDVFATQQEKKILPFIPEKLDNLLKYHFGWYLISLFKKF